MALKPQEDARQKGDQRAPCPVEPFDMAACSGFTRPVAVADGSGNALQFLENRMVSSALAPVIRTNLLTPCRSCL
ncbi:MAG: hypothetical protein ACTSU0_02590 [Alphaproteobacteria bacterium]